MLNLKALPTLLATVAVIFGGSASFSPAFRAQLSNTYVEARTAVDLWFAVDADLDVNGDASSAHTVTSAAAYGQADIAAYGAHSDDGDCEFNKDVSADAQLDAFAGASLAVDSNEGEGSASLGAALDLETGAGVH